MLKELFLNDSNKIIEYIKNNTEDVVRSNSIQKHIANYYMRYDVSTKHVLKFLETIKSYCVSFDNDLISSIVIKNVEHKSFEHKYNEDIEASYYENIENDDYHIIYKTYYKNIKYVMPYLTNEQKDNFIKSFIYEYSHEYCSEMFLYLLEYGENINDLQAKKMIDYLIDIKSQSLDSLLNFKIAKEYVPNILNAIKNIDYVYLDEKYDNISKSEDLDLLLNIILERLKDADISNDFYEVTSFIKNYNNVSMENKNKIINFLIEKEKISNLVEITRYNIDKSNLNKIGEEILNHSIIFVYTFLKINYNNEDLDKDLKKKLVDKLLKSRELYYITCFTLFVDQKYIKKIFKSNKQLLCTIQAYGIDMSLEDRLNKKEKDKIAKKVKKNIKKLIKENE